MHGLINGVCVMAANRIIVQVLNFPQSHFTKTKWMCCYFLNDIVSCIISVY